MYMYFQKDSNCMHAGYFFHALTFFFKINFQFFKIFFQELTIRVSNGLNPDQDRHSDPDLGPRLLGDKIFP